MTTSTSTSSTSSAEPGAPRSKTVAGRTSLYDLVGGHEGLTAAVTVFYQRVLADPALRPWFVGVDIGRLRMHQRAFLAAALGGPDLFAARDLVGAHADLGVTPQAFDAVVDHLACTLRDLGVDTSVVARIGEHVDTLRPQIVAVGPGDPSGSPSGSTFPKSSSGHDSTIRHAR